MVCAHARCLEVFANELRLELLQEIQQNPQTATQLAKKTMHERTKIVHALTELKKCHLVSAQRKGKEVYYVLNKHTPLEKKGNILELMEHHAQHNCANCHKI